MVSLILTLNRFHTLFCVFIVNFEQVNSGWGQSLLSQVGHIVERPDMWAVRVKGHILVNLGTSLYMCS